MFVDDYLTRLFPLITG